MKTQRWMIVALMAFALMATACDEEDSDDGRDVAADLDDARDTSDADATMDDADSTMDDTDSTMDDADSTMADGDADVVDPPLDPATAPRASVDRFSADAGTLFVRDANGNLPAADAPIDFDQAPFITQGLGPNGETIQYYNFDVQPQETAPIFVLFREGEQAPVDGQLNIVGVIPGDAGYNDFWHVHAVTVPTDYVANTLTSVAEVMDSGYAIERTDIVVNCPVVPEGSTATLRYGAEESSELVMGWYDDQVVTYFEFAEAPTPATVPADSHAIVTLSPIYVMFNVNPDMADPNSGPASGFMTEMDGVQTHNVAATLPGDMDYSPLWSVNVLDNAAFDSVTDLASAEAETPLATGVATVNCPIVSVQ